MKKIVFTLCSNNYIPQAKLLIESFLKFNIDYLFVLGLVDEKSDKLNYFFNDKTIVIECKDVLPAYMLDRMKRNYKIVELNTTVKPFYFQYFFEQYKECELIVFLDPDIYVYSSFKYLEDCLYENDIVLTPHTCLPVPLDGKKPNERTYLKYGTYNLGFIAVKRSSNTNTFLKWLAERMLNFCYMEINLGMYVDQLWFNLVPVFFKKVFISNHLGLNCAFWNLHERSLSVNENNQFMINENFSLIFFHFSALDIHNIDSISKSQNRYNLKNRVDLSLLVNEYAIKLIAAKQESNYNIPCVYTNKSFLQKFFYYKNRFIIRKKLVV